MRTGALPDGVVTHLVHVECDDAALPYDSRAFLRILAQDGQHIVRCYAAERFGCLVADHLGLLLVFQNGEEGWDRVG